MLIESEKKLKGENDKKKESAQFALFSKGLAIKQSLESSEKDNQVEKTFDENLLLFSSWLSDPKMDGRYLWLWAWRNSQNTPVRIELKGTRLKLLNMSKSF